jgi:D-arabinose 1-dehydrogenase-like Zn-dependent alcohol dehydrogenase
MSGQEWLVIRPSSLVSARHSLAGSAIGRIRETQEMLDSCSKNNIAWDIELTPIQRMNARQVRRVNTTLPEYLLGLHTEFS